MPQRFPQRVFAAFPSQIRNNLSQGTDSPISSSASGAIDHVKSRTDIPLRDISQYVTWPHTPSAVTMQCAAHRLSCQGTTARRGAPSELNRCSKSMFIVPDVVKRSAYAATPDDTSFPASYRGRSQLRPLRRRRFLKHSGNRSVTQIRNAYKALSRMFQSQFCSEPASESGHGWKCGTWRVYDLVYSGRYLWIMRVSYINP